MLTVCTMQICRSNADGDPFAYAMRIVDRSKQLIFQAQRKRQWAEAIYPHGEGCIFVSNLPFEQKTLLTTGRLAMPIPAILQMFQALPSHSRIYPCSVDMFAATLFVHIRDRCTHACMKCVMLAGVATGE